MHTSTIVPLLLHPSHFDQELVEKREGRVELGPEALIREARLRQRKRRLVLVTVALALIGAGVAVWRTAFIPGRHAAHERAPTPAALPSTLTLHLVGWGTVVQGYSGVRGGGCRDGVSSIPIVTSTGQHVGALSECDLVVSMTKRSNGDVLRTQANMLGSYKLPGGTIRTREQRTFSFARDQIHTYGHFSGHVVSGSGQFAHARGTISGGGPGNTGGPGESDTTHWTVVFHFH